jgi:hypothetical protein
LQGSTRRAGTHPGCPNAVGRYPHVAGSTARIPMAQLYLPDEAPASTPEPPQPPPVGDKDRPRDRKRPPEPDDEAPETPPSDPKPVPVQDPPAEPGSRGPYVV